MWFSGFLFSLPIALIWVGVTGRLSPGSFLVGYLIGIASFLLLCKLGVRFQKSFRLQQPVALIQYAGLLLWSGLLASIQVVKLVLSPKIELRTGVVALPTGDHSANQQLAALSAHGINMSPGELVIDFDDNGVLYVHCLDLEAARPTLESDQARRLQLLRRMMGIPEHE